MVKIIHVQRFKLRLNGTGIKHYYNFPRRLFNTMSMFIISLNALIVNFASRSLPHLGNSSSSSDAFAQVIRVAHSGLRSSCRFRRIHSSLIISDAIVFKVSILFEYLFIADFSLVLVILMHSWMMCSWVSLSLLQNLHRLVVSWPVLWFSFIISIDALALSTALHCFLLS